MALNLNTIKQFFLQESKRGVVDDKILNELQVDLIRVYEDMYSTQVMYDDMQENPEKYFAGEAFLNSPDFLDDPFIENETAFEEIQRRLPKAQVISMSATYTPEMLKEVLSKLKRAKTDKQKIIAINEALNQAHDSGNILGQDYDNLRNSLGKKLSSIKSILIKLING